MLPGQHSVPVRGRLPEGGVVNGTWVIVIGCLLILAYAVVDFLSERRGYRRGRKEQRMLDRGRRW